MAPPVILSNTTSSIIFYANGWENKAQEVTAQNIADSTIFTTFLDSQIQQQPPPKLEDFLGNDSSLVRYSDSQTETQDSSLTHLYDQGGSAYFHDHNDLKTVPAAAGFQAFSGNSVSEVDDSVSVARTQLGSTESGTELGFSQCPNGALSLGVRARARARGSEKALVSVDSESCKKISDTFGQRTSIYRGVTRHRWTGRYEAHLWDNSCRREGQARKGRQGGYDKEDKAARAYDLAALKYWGPTATTNFPVSSYTKEIEEMKHVTKQEFIASLRRKSSGFSRGASIYRGVTRHHQQGRWQARIGRVAGNKDLYLGTFATEEEAAEAYDIAAIKFRGVNAVTNFEMNRYDVEAIMKSSLPIGGAAKRLKLSPRGGAETVSEPRPTTTPMHHLKQRQLFHQYSPSRSCPVWSTVRYHRSLPPQSLPPKY
ncbi:AINTEGUMENTA-like 7 [Actinidia rufa]|uniref:AINTEGUMENTA-like 7 n=1 Tax=Actinidia rufa TaxID=165716 RepID=A0A7J0F6M7_9ERIC|nr:AINTEGUMENTA-like 7 [Actinidia rufa]